MTKILLINDMQISLIACQKLITNAFPDVKIITSSSGNEGIDKALKEIPDLIIINLAIPAKDGIETCKSLKEHDSLLLIPVIMISDTPSDSLTRIEALEAGALLFLTKPINEVELVAQISTVIKYKKEAKRLLSKDRRISHHKKLRVDELEWELKKVYKALDSSPVSVLITDATGNIVYCNPKVSELTGYPVKELYGKNPRIFQSGETVNEVYQDMWNTILSGKEWQGEFHNKKRNGELYWESVLISPIFHANGDIINFLAVKEDITAKKKMMDDLEISRKQSLESDRLKSAFFNNVTHEIRTPLNAILGFADLLKNNDLKDLERKEFVGIIEKSGLVLLNTVNELIEIASIEAGMTKVTRSAINLNEQIELVYNFFKSEIAKKGINFSYNTPLSYKQSMIIVDSEKLNFILVSLVSNAMKFSHKGKIELGYSKKGLTLEFYVKDNGIGIREEQKKLIFESFRQCNETLTRDFQGLGLGLTISKAFVEMLGGKIWIESGEGDGSIFYFSIPYNSGWKKEIVVNGEMYW